MDDYGPDPALVNQAPAGLGPSGFDLGQILEALSELPKGWWWSIGTCSVSNDASIGPDVAYCDKETLIHFDDGLHADLPHPSTIADALRDCIRQAREAGVV